MSENTTAVQPMICGKCGMIVTRLEKKNGTSVWMCISCARKQPPITASADEGSGEG